MAGTSTTPFTFRVTYADEDNAAPAYVRVLVGAYTLDMAKQSPSDVDYRDGCTYVATTNLPWAAYSYRFEASDGGLNVSTPWENGPYVDTAPPTSYLSRLSVAPVSGFSYTTFYFQVNYSHAGNVAPSFIYLKVDSYNYPVYKLSASDNTYTDGCVYYSSTTLPLGLHTYSFWAHDGSTTISTPTYTGLIVRSFASTVGLTQMVCSPPSGDTNTDFQFRVRYSQPSNLPPDYVYVSIDGTPYQMSKEYQGETTYDDGCFFIYSTRLSEGSHSYYFSAGRSDDSRFTSSLSIDVQKGSFLGDPPQLLAFVFIALGSVATISTLSVAYKIKAKKGHTTPLSPSLSPTPVQSSMSWNQRWRPTGPGSTHGRGGPAAGSPVPVTPGFLPPSAFVTQPAADPPLDGAETTMPPGPADQLSAPAGAMPGAGLAVPQEPLLPGTPKWMRLARFDISLYTAP
ncbi:MAG: hypothetical protein JW839_16030, partial [Candidatus Lokiarchaeota archaeon]|nr:hypothetical protein [Candidatus Lokiarchaeota archaeon]